MTTIPIADIILRVEPVIFSNIKFPVMPNGKVNIIIEGCVKDSN